MTFNKKLALVGFVGIVIIILVSIAGCGEVSTTGLETDTDGGAGAGGAMADGGEMRGEVGGRGGAGSVSGTAGAGGVGGAAGRVLGAGCSTDDQCGSSICDSASHTCCDGHADSCNTCVGGYKTPVANGPVSCGVCEGGTLLPSQDGTVCGASCDGPKKPDGFGPTGTYQDFAVNSTCHAGVCVPTTQDCSMITCPTSCMKQYQGCLLNVNGGDGFMNPGAACFCVGTNGNICH